MSVVDSRKVMIFCKGVDRTIDIRNCEAIGNRYRICFKNGREYFYNRNNIRIFHNPESISFKNKSVFHNQILLENISKILLFGKKHDAYYRIFRLHQDPFSAPVSEFEFLENAATPQSTFILDYYRHIVCLLESRHNEEKGFLTRLYDRLGFIHPESILAAYLNRRYPTYTGNFTSRTYPLIFPFRFNLSQKTALENALSNPVSVIEGPPGTGKTQTILNILANLVAVGKKSVAVVSFNNEAVNNIRDKLDKAGYGFLVADLGRKEKRENFFNQLQQADVSSFKSTSSLGSLEKEIGKLNQQLAGLLAINNSGAQLRQELAAYRLEQQHFEKQIEGKSSRIEKLPLFAKSSEKLITCLADLHLADRLGIHSTFLFKLKLLFKYGIFRFWKKSGKMDFYVTLQREFYRLKIHELEKIYRKNQEYLEKHSFDSLSETHYKKSVEYFRKQLYELYFRLAKPSFTEKALQDSRHFRKFLKYYPVILSTNHSLLNSIPDHYLLDYVIIDEASQVDLLTALPVLSRCRNLIVVGDTKQLPQIIDTKLDKTGLSSIPAEYDYFSQNILSSILAVFKQHVPRVILKEHYRCHPEIIGFCNRKYYNDELIPFTSADMSEKPLVLYKTAKGNHSRQITHDYVKERGIYNQREIDIVQNEMLEKLGINPEKDDIGFVTPYRRQVCKASRILPDYIVSDTVHKYQGREKDIIILSTVLDKKSGRNHLHFVDDPHLVNVAVSRARKKLIVDTDHDYFMKHGKHMRDLCHYIQYHTLDSQVIESDVISVFDLLYKNYSDKLKKLQARLSDHSQFRSENIIHALLEDILSRPEYSDFTFVAQVRLHDIFRNPNFANTGSSHDMENDYLDKASVDFVIYRKCGNRFAFAIEVDGFAFHENNPEQLTRDRLKQAIFDKYGLKIPRLPTNGSGEEQKILAMLDRVQQSYG